VVLGLGWLALLTIATRREQKYGDQGRYWFRRRKKKPMKSVDENERFNGV
jgi:hypothetical protein